MILLISKWGKNTKKDATDEMKENVREKKYRRRTKIFEK